jgi:hypothetical protein
MRFVHVLLTASAAVLFLLGSPGFAGSEAKAVKPRLSLVRDTPTVLVRGAHFSHRERVRVTFRANGDPSSRVVRTTVKGTFFASPPTGFAYSPCASPLVVDASGAKGDHARLRVPQRECPAA